MKTYGELRYSSIILDLGTSLSGQPQAPAALPLAKFPPCTYWIGDWVGPNEGVDSVEKRKVFPLSGIVPRASGS
jgi:hypothetical protein